MERWISEIKPGETTLDFRRTISTAPVGGPRFIQMTLHWSSASGAHILLRVSRSSWNNACEELTESSDGTGSAAYHCTMTAAMSSNGMASHSTSKIEGSLKRLSDAARRPFLRQGASF